MGKSALRTGIAAASLFASLVVACGPSREDRAAGARESRSAVISDQVHNHGVPGFFWLPPIAPTTAYGEFKPGLAPEVVIERLPVGSSPPVARFSAAEVQTDGESHYKVNWDTKSSSLDPTVMYRIRVVLGWFELGYADVDVVSSGSELHKVSSGEYFPLLDGRTLPIKFRIDLAAMKCPERPGGPCKPLDQCHVAGTCDPLTGACSNPEKQNDTACNDGNACTQTDTCQAGVCTGANPVVCTASDQCHDAGVCDPADGVCSNPTKTDGATCNDGDACTQTDTCQAGACDGVEPGRLHRVGSVPRRGHLRAVERHVLEPGEGRRRRVQRRERLHADRHVPGRRVHGLGPGGVHRVGSVPRRRRNATLSTARARTRRTPARRATTGTPARRATRARPARASGRTRSSAPPWTSATARAPATRRTARARTRRRATARRATTGAAAPGPTRARPAGASGRTRSSAPRWTSATTRAPATPRPARARTRRTRLRATTGTPAPGPTRARTARARARIRWSAPRWTGATTRAAATRERARVRCRPRRATARRAATGTRARRPTRARRESAPGRTRSSAPRRRGAAGIRAAATRAPGRARPRPRSPPTPCAPATATSARGSIARTARAWSRRRRSTATTACRVPKTPAIRARQGRTA